MMIAKLIRGLLFVVLVSSASLTGIWYVDSLSHVAGSAAYYFVYWCMAFTTLYWTVKSLVYAFGFAYHLIGLTGLVSTESVKILFDYLWRFVAGPVYHDHDLRGTEKLQSNQSYVFVMFHAKEVMIVGGFVCLRLRDELGLDVWTIGHRTNMKETFVERFLELINVHALDRAGCVDVLKSGSSILVYPGGLEEYRKSDLNYEIVWPENRIGFADVSKTSGAKVVPLFMRNCNEIAFYRRWAESIPLWPSQLGTKIPLGCFPVKLRTFIGDPIDPALYDTAEELALAAKEALTKLRDKHQIIPGSVWRGIYERFVDSPDDITAV